MGIKSSLLSGSTPEITFGSPVAETPGDSNTDGVATTASRSDHKHALPAYGTSSGTIMQGNQAAGGDVSGTLNSITVTRARGLRDSGGTTYSTSSFTDGQFLRISGSNIVTANPSAATDTFWATQTTITSNQTLAVNNVYIINTTTLLSLTLPTTHAVGDRIFIGCRAWPSGSNHSIVLPSTHKINASTASPRGLDSAPAGDYPHTTPYVLLLSVTDTDWVVAAGRVNGGS